MKSACNRHEMEFQLRIHTVTVLPHHKMGQQTNRLVNHPAPFRCNETANVYSILSTRIIHRKSNQADLENMEYVCKHQDNELYFTIQCLHDGIITGTTENSFYITPLYSSLLLRAFSFVLQYIIPKAHYSSGNLLPD